MQGTVDYFRTGVKVALAMFGADELLLPLMYWQEQLRRTRCPGQKAPIALVLQAVEEAFERHPCTRQLKPEVLAANLAKTSFPPVRN